MGIDGILHPRMSFGELSSLEVEQFLEARAFESEHLCLEFKSNFPRVGLGPRFNIEKVCQYVVAFLNADGGFLIYGVSDRIVREKCSVSDILTDAYPAPSIEDLTQWFVERIVPMPAGIGIRTFTVRDRRLAVVRVPNGMLRPYGYYDPAERVTKFFTRTPGGVRELRGAEIGESFRANQLETAVTLVRAGRKEVASVGIGGWRVILSRARERG